MEADLQGSAGLRAWALRLGAALLVGLLVGLLCYLLARLVLGAYLLYHQQELMRITSSALGGGVESLASAEGLRELRREAEARAATTMARSAELGVLAGGVAALAAFLHLQHRRPG